MSEGAVGSYLAIAKGRLDTLLRSLGHLSSLPQAQSLTLLLQELEIAQAELQTATAKVNQQYQDLSALYRSAIEERKYYSSVGAIAQRLRQSLEPVVVLELTVATIRQLLQVERAVIYRLEGDERATVIAESVEPGWRSLLGTQIDRATVQNLLKFCGQLDDDALSQSANAPLELVELVLRQESQSIFVVPILLKKELFGILCVYQCARFRQWQSCETESLQQLATEVAIALQQSELYQQAQQLNADLEQQVQQRTAQLQTALNYESMLKRITDKVRDSLDERQILQAVVRELASVLGLAGCNAALYDLDQNISTVRYEYIRSIPTSQGKVARMDDFPEIYHQLKQGLYFQFCSLLPNPKRGRVAMLACPIFVDPASSQGINQAVLGDLWLIHTPDHIFHELEIRLVQQVANHCAIAIRQVRLYQAAQGQVQELEKLNRLKDEFLSTVSHELRTPITNVKMAVQMLKIAPNEDRRNHYLRILEQEANREAELIDNLLDLQRLEAAAHPVQLEPIDLKTWLPHLVEPFQERMCNRQQAFRIDLPAELPVLVSDAVMLQRILTELLQNACKYTIADGEISITIARQAPSAEFAEPGMVFMVQNQAHIPEAELSKVFDKFYRCPNADPWRQGGTGLGLALVQKLVERLQGTIAVESVDGWTTFTVRLPEVAMAK